jgi:hypothetical protein
VRLARPGGEERASIGAGEHALLRADGSVEVGRQPRAPVENAQVLRAADTGGARPDARLVREILRRTEAGELALLRGMPLEILAGLHGDTPDETGFVAQNKEGFACAGEQRFAIRTMAMGVVLARRDLIDESWRAIEAVLPFQTPAGGFLDPLYCDVQWLGQVSHALLLLRESELREAYADRIARLLPHVARLAAWLSHPPPLKELQGPRRGGNEGGYPNDAIAFGLSGVLLDNEHLKELGHEFMDRMLALQRPDGAFVISGGTDLAIQGSAVLRLGIFVSRFPEARYAEALRRAGDWELSRVTPQGEVNLAGNVRRLYGRDCKDVPLVGCWTIDFDAFTWGLLYYTRLVEPSRQDAVAQVHRTRRLVER